ncbi:uncharacterized protein LOC133203645 [Saccostrea echinata]|uniref:uncharacterized protein LOC133203645 n=1 Tax=Saccostrea echinata TaxID=191078 RepID=UPI002A81EC27|nr:uncharacterized protein LOC133203645 [Saccostrea echinata]
MSRGVFVRYWVLFCISWACFGYASGNVLMRRDEFDDFDQYINDTLYINDTYIYVEDDCNGLFSCPATTLNSTDQEGNLYLGENFFSDYCKYVQELLDCAEERDIYNDPECVDQRKYLSMYTKKETNLCMNPIYPLLQNLRQCINSLNQKLDNFTKILRPLMTPIGQDFTTNKDLSNDSFCQTYNQILDETIEAFKGCPSNKVQWSSKNISIIRKNYYPVTTGSTPPF